MKVLKLSVDYDGYYGGDIHEYCLLPIEWNGLYIEKLETGRYSNEIYLGEIEGKHSQVYGDLVVEIVDLSELNKRELSELIKGSDIGNFESFFEGGESNFYGCIEDDEEAHKLKQSVFEKINGIKFNSDWSIKSAEISENLVAKLSGQLEDFTEIVIKASDLHSVAILLRDNGIEIFN